MNNINRMAKRILSFSIVLTMLFTFISPEMLTFAAAPESVGEAWINDDFSDSEAERAWLELVDEDAEDSATVSIEDGAIKVVRDSDKASLQPYAKIYFKEDKTAITEPTAISFKVSREEASQLAMRTDSSEVNVFWYANGQIRPRTYTEVGGTASAGSKGTFASPVTVTYVINPVVDMYSMWVNGTKKVTGSYLAKATDMTYMAVKYDQAALVDGDTDSFTVDDVKVYTPVLDDSDKAVYDKGWLTDKLIFGQQEKTAITENINLPNEGIYGSTITWNIEPSGAVSNTGAVTRGETDATVTLTATITSGDQAAEKTFEFTVKGEDPAEDALELYGPGAVGEPWINDKFSDAQAEREWLELVDEDDTDSATVSLENGAIKVVRDGDKASLQPYAKIYFKEDKTAITEPTAISFKVSREEASQLAMRTNSSEVNVFWYDNGQIRPRTYTEVGGKATAGSKGTFTSPITVTYVIDPVTDMYSMWVNGTKKVTNSYLAKATDMTYMAVKYDQAALVDGDTDSFTVDNVKVYTPVLTDSDKAGYDKGWLTDKLIFGQQDKNAITENINLPETGIYGSAITWGIEPSGVISNTGAVTRGETDTTVTLTATIVKGEVTEEKTFTLTVSGETPAEEEPEESGPEADGEPWVNDDFSDASAERPWLVFNDTDESDATSVGISDGKIKIVRNAEYKPSANIYFNEDKSPITETTAISFTVSREEAAELVFKTNDSQIFNFWYAGGDIRPRTYTEVGGKATAGSKGTFSSPVTITYVINPTVHMYSMWINGVEKVKKSYLANSNDIRYLTVVNNQTALVDGDTDSHTIDNVKIYRPLLTQQDEVEYDAGWITYSLICGIQSKTAITENINLPKTAPGGSTIAWNIEPSGVISNEGQVTRSETNVPVTLKATVTRGQVTTEKTFELTVLNKNSDGKGPDSVGDPWIKDDFSDEGKARPWLSLSDKDVLDITSATIENGAIRVVRGDGKATEQPSATIYLKEDKTPITEPTAISFKVSREEAAEMRFSASNSEVFVFWYASGQIRPRKYPYVGGTATAPSIGNFGNTMVVTLVLNPVSKIYTMWINGKIVAENYYFANGNDISSVSINYNGSGLVDGETDAFTVDDVKVYTPVMSDSEKVFIDRDSVTLSDLTLQPQRKLTMDLTLPTVGEFYQSEIVWTSSNPAVIDSTGKVTRSEDSDQEVTLTATFKRNDATPLTKEFEFKVLRRNLANTPPDEVGESIYTNDGISTTNNKIYFNPAGVAYRGNYAVSFSLNRKAASEVKLSLIQGSKNVLSTHFNGDKFNAISRESDLATVTSDICYADSVGKEVDITVFVSTANQLCYVWIDNEVVCEGVYSTDFIDGVSGLSIESDSEVDLKYISFYEAQLNDSMRVYMDSEYIGFSKFALQSESYVYKSFELPAKGINGSDFIWHAEGTGLASDGTVTNPSSGTTSAKLTATIKSGNESKDVTYNLTIVPKSTDELPEFREMIIQEDFLGDSLHPNWSLDPGSGIALKKHGELVLSGNSRVNTDFFLTSDRSNIKGVVCAEYVYELSSSTDKLMHNTNGNNSSWITDLRYTGGKLRAQYSTEPNTEADSHVLSLPSKGLCVNVKVLYDSETRLFSLWIDDKLILKDIKAKSSPPGINNMGFTHDKGTSIIRDIKVYYAAVPVSERIQKDYNYLTLDKIMNPAVYNTNILNEDMHLMDTGYYGSAISWSSSNENILTNDGKINLNTATAGEVTLTATFSVPGQESVSKDFTVRVIKELSTSEEKAQADLDLITEETLSPEVSKDIRMSLNFMDKGLYGSDITYQSSNENVITKSGRVITNRVGEGDVDVSVVVTVTNGDTTLSKTLEYTVLADEEIGDADHMPDSEFFGVWDEASGKWVVESKLDYERNSGLAKVGEIAKTGDYEAASVALLEYMRNREDKMGSPGRSSKKANALADGHVGVKGDWAVSDFKVTNSWETVTADIPVSFINPGASTDFVLIAWYNESSEALFASRNHSDPALRPRMELVVNGKEYTAYTSDDATVRAGKYRNENYGTEEYLKTKVFGDFLDDETYKIFLKFDFSGIPAGGKITSAKLKLYGCAFPANSGEKRIFVYNDRMSKGEAEIAWKDSTTTVYSYNGLPEGSNWNRHEENTDSEFTIQATRLGFASALAGEYKVTGNERYAYAAIRRIADYIWDKGGYKTSDGIRFGHTKNIDCTSRSGSIANSYDVLIQSKYMTPDINLAMLKHVYDMMSGLMVYRSSAEGNMASIEMNALQEFCLKMPEFRAVEKEWLPLLDQEFGENIFISFLPDGAYNENTGSYNAAVYNYMRVYKDFLMRMGRNADPEYDERLRQGGYYNILLSTPDGRSILYGDSSEGTVSREHSKQVALWVGDEELLYIATDGKQGTEPSWTSKTYSKIAVEEPWEPLPNGTVQLPKERTFMRSDWTKNSLYLYTNVSGPGTHGHNDSNSVTVSAFGRTLIQDAGVFTYSNDPLRIWGVSSAGHNSVTINGGMASSSEILGEVTDWKTAKKYDYLSQYGTTLDNGKHTRSIFFVKPNLWIVSDIVKPQDSEFYANNEIKQNWHLAYDSKMTIDGNIARTNYPDGANIIVASADEDATMIEEEGWYSSSTGNQTDSPYAAVTKTGSGIQTFDTVLVPSNDSPDSEVEVTRLETGTDATVSTAMKIDKTVNSISSTAYYYMTYEDENIPVRTFGKYETDAKVAYVDTLSNGTVSSIVILDGTYILDTEADKFVINLSEKADVSVGMKGATVIMETSSEDALRDSTVGVTVATGLEVNGESKDFAKYDGYIKPYEPASRGETSAEEGKGGIVVEGGAGGSGSEDSSKDDKEEKPEDKPEDEPDDKPYVSFKDIESHWAKGEIEALHKDGIVNGKTQTQFCPDDNITRAEFLTLVMRVASGKKSVYKGTFKDVNSNDWYAESVQFGLDAGIISEADYFRPNDLITREEMAKIIVQTYKIDNVPLPEDLKAGYSDVDENRWSYEYIAAADYLLLINGMGDGNFAPYNCATRAQSAVIIKRFMDLVK